LEQERKPSAIAHADLLRRLNLVAAGGLLVPLWRQGIRHPLALRAVRRHAVGGYTPDETRDFIVAVASAAGDDEIHDRRLAVKSSAEAQAAGKPAKVFEARRADRRAAIDVLKRWLGLGSAVPWPGCREAAQARRSETTARWWSRTCPGSRSSRCSGCGRTGSHAEAQRDRWRAGTVPSRS